MGLADDEKAGSRMTFTDKVLSIRSQLAGSIYQSSSASQIRDVLEKNL